jgi:hypothetical protein
VVSDGPKHGQPTCDNLLGLECGICASLLFHANWHLVSTVKK